MKKIVLFSLMFVLLSGIASAQTGSESRFRKQGTERGFSRGPSSMQGRSELRKDVLRNRMLKRRALRDGVVTPSERRRLHRAKCETRRDQRRIRHRNRHRVI